MMRGLWLAAPLLCSIIASTASAQRQADPPRSLSEHFARFRQNLLRGEEQEAPAPRTASPPANRRTSTGATQSSGLPRVNSRDLLPDDVFSSRGTAPTPPRVAALPERFQRDSTSATATSSAAGIANGSTAKSASTAPVRRSPLKSPRHEFDAEELRRDLVATNAPSAGTSASTTLTPAGSESAATEIASSTTAQPASGPLSDRYAATPSVRDTSPTEPKPQVQVEEAPNSSGDVPQRLMSMTLTAPPSSGPPVAMRSDSLEASQLPAASQSDLRTLFENGASTSDILSQNRALPIPEDVLLSQKLPQIVSHVSGPRQIVVGREATFRVWIANRGELAADELVTRIKVPAWAELKAINPTNGSFDQQPTPGEGEIKWVLARLDAQKYETLDVVLIAKESRPIELGVDWAHAPVDSRTVVEVREPKLEMTVTGPEEALFGRPQIYRLTLSNPGTAAAEEVTIHLLQPGAGDTQGSSHAFGNLAASETKTAEVELTAREPGKLFVRASASAAGGLTAAAEKEIFCRKPELEVDWRGPERKYAGTQATYYFRVRNPGTAAAENVQFQVELPAGFEVIETNGGAVPQKGAPRITWNLENLQPGDDRYLELKGTIKQPGANEFRFAAASQDDFVKDSGSMTTEVTALADLKLQVSDPAGPVAVGEDAVYEIRVINRGASAAEQVTVAALFSEGIDPQTAEGMKHTIADGRVAFHPIEKLSPGEELTLRVRARGVAAGTHLFRAEVLCQELEIKLAAEETTRFFADDVSPIQTADESTGAAQDAGASYRR